MLKQHQNAMNHSLRRYLIPLCLLPLLAAAQDKWTVMDMVHNNPGEAPTQTEFNTPDTLHAYGYNAKVFFLFDAAQFGIDWNMLSPDIMPEGSNEHQWMMSKRRTIEERYAQAHEAGLDVYCMLDMIVLPRRLVQLYADSLLNDKGKIDISKPFTQHCVRLMMRQMFRQFPDLDGLVIRTGETYLHDAPYHQGNNPVQGDVVADHVTLINILREEVCDRLDRKIVYRTWDFGQFHSLPRYYLDITSQVEPHPNLLFSVKHTTTDFWRGAVTQGKPDYAHCNSYWIYETSKQGNPFNPTIGIGRHKQIVEVQCQREYEGKGAHVNYIAAGVINGFPEYRDAAMPRPFCLSDLRYDSNVRGIWTWTRGGGWGGPYPPDEFWVELNAYVLAQWACGNASSEEEAFRMFALKKGLAPRDIDKFHTLCLLSLDGVMMGQYSKMGGTWVNWTRDASVFDSAQLAFMKDILRQGKQREYAKEKHETVKIWKRICRLAQQLRFADPQLTRFVRNSCTYALLKYTFFADAWDVLMCKVQEEEDNVPAHTPHYRSLLTKARASLAAWDQFITDHDLSSLRYDYTQWEKCIGE